MELEQQNLPSDTGEGNIITIEENECLAFGIRIKPNVLFIENRLVNLPFIFAPSNFRNLRPAT